MDKIIRLHRHFEGRARVGFGWGTLLTNDFRGMADDGALDPFSLVCKAVEANGRPTVKLSDNSRKALGPVDEVERYQQVFGIGKQAEMEVSGVTTCSISWVTNLLICARGATTFRRECQPGPRLLRLPAGHKSSR